MSSKCQSILCTVLTLTMIGIEVKHIPTRMAILSSTLPTRTWNLLISQVPAVPPDGYAHHAANNVGPRALLVDQGKCSI
jgi:hypothetical protein